jgi:transcriptional regulator with XRE-family HTH domain
MARVARNIRHFRRDRGYTADELAARARVDLAAVSQIEGGDREPSLSEAWRISAALDVPFSALTNEQAPRGTVVVRADQALQFASARKGLSSRSLLPYADGVVEFYELKLAPHYRENCEAHGHGVMETLHLASGTVEVSVGREAPHLLRRGDTIQFPGDLPHAYANLGSEPALLYLLITYPHSSGLGSVQNQELGATTAA